MNKNQQSKMRMYQNVRRFLENNPAAWTDIPAYVDAFGRFTALTDQILVTNTEQRIAITGHATERKRQRALLNDQLMQITGALQSLARKTRNHVLLHNVRIAPSVLATIGESKHQAFRNRILQEAVAHLTELGDFGITQAHVTALEASINSYHALVIQPRMAILERSQRTERLKLLFADADDILRGEMDPMLPLLAVQDAELVMAYRSARNIIHYGGRSAHNNDVDIGTNESL